MAGLTRTPSPLLESNLHSSTNDLEPQQLWRLALEVDVKDLINKPLETIDIISDAERRVNPKEWVGNLTKGVHKMITNAPRYVKDEIPDLEVMGFEELKAMNGRVVRFRCMMQESYDPILCQPTAVVKNRESGEMQRRCGLYRSGLLDCELDFGDEHQNPQDLREMHMFHAISVPGRNKWTRAGNDTCLTKSMLGLSLRDDQYTLLSVRGLVDYSLLIPILAFPCAEMLTNPECKACIMKVSYYENGEIKLNDVVDFYGILDLSEEVSLSSTSRSLDLDEMDFEVAEDVIKFNPDPMLVQRFMVLGFERCSSNYELVPNQMLTRVDLGAINAERDSLRGILLDLFTDIMLGDKLAAKYLLANIISSVFERSDELADPYGHLPVRYLKVPDGMGIFVNEILSSLVENSVFIRKTDKFSSLKLTPYRDVKCGKLCAGILQLSAGTHLLWEEPEVYAKEEGNLDVFEKEQINLEVLARLTKDQIVHYKLELGDLEIRHNIPVIIFSSYGMCTSKTSIDCLADVPLEPKIDANRYKKEMQDRVRKMMNDNVVMTKLRYYIVMMKHQEHEIKIPPAMREKIEKDFLDSRIQNRNEAKMSQIDLHRALVISRYWLNALGKTELTPETWTSVRLMEIERKARIYSFDNNRHGCVNCSPVN